LLKQERGAAVSAVSIRLEDRFRRLVSALRRAWLPVPGVGRIDPSSRDVGPPSVDFRPARPGSRPELEEMAQRYGVDLARVPLDLPGAVRDAERTCLNCQDVRRCRRWLARETVDDPRLFCANAPLFKVIAAKWPDAPRRRR
jgi:hypothetical protein